MRPCIYLIFHQSDHTAMSSCWGILHLQTQVAHKDIYCQVHFQTCLKKLEKMAREMFVYLFIIFMLLPTHKKCQYMFIYLLISCVTYNVRENYKCKAQRSPDSLNCDSSVLFGAFITILGAPFRGKLLYLYQLTSGLGVADSSGLL